ncbi:hypothetical protein HETIRDRAFT_328778, partial [Heterobasidion irregulare TC 32-1]
VKCGRTDPSAAEHPLEGYGRSGGDRPCSVQVGIFGTRLTLFGISPKLPKYLPWTLARVHAHQRKTRFVPQDIKLYDLVRKRR